MCSKRPGIWRVSRFLIHAVLPLLIRLNETYGWNNNDGESDTDKYYQSGLNYWLGDMTAMSVVYHGCVWGYTDDYGEDAGCMEAESEDGTTDWYRMANCRRAQVAYSVYGSESSKSASCDSKTFLDTYATKTGLYGWAYYLENYDGNAPITTDDLADLPYCEEYDDYHYMSIGCSSTGTFTIDLFSDEDCLTYNSTYDDLADINSALSTMSSCYSAYSSSSGYTVYNSFIGKILGYSDSCSPVDSQICQDANGMKSKNTQYSSVSNTGASSTASPTGLSFVNQVKYGVGSVFLFSSFLMFLGILFTNRRKRRALMHRKFRHSSKRTNDDKHRSRRRSKSSKRGKDRERSRSHHDLERNASKVSTSSRNSKSGRSRSRSAVDDEGGTFA
mmetsp:Transcript_21883/g.25097  ORF Transcript_21883/g.25097 Transcript_21883/m.25097 type:complete len:388 (-) Transcript_21883:332-1495(-)